MASAVLKDSSDTCKLCLRSQVVLRRSHLYPQAAYKAIRAVGSRNPNPVFIQDGKARSTSLQLTEPMLCDDCEHRFELDELYASRIWLHPDGRIPLLQDLVPAQPASDDGWIVAEPTERVQVERLVRFASVCLWRCHVSSLVPSCSLGDEYGEKFRRYVLGETPFPEDCTVMLCVLQNTRLKGLPRLSKMMAFPLSKRDGSHSLYICGLHFEFGTNSGAADEDREFCLVHGDPRLIMSGPPDILDDWVGDDIRLAHANGRQRAQRKRPRVTIR